MKLCIAHTQQLCGVVVPGEGGREGGRGEEGGRKGGREEIGGRGEREGSRGKREIIDGSRQAKVWRVVASRLTHFGSLCRGQGMSRKSCGVE